MLTHLHIKNFKAWKDTGPGKRQSQKKQQQQPS